MRLLDLSHASGYSSPLEFIKALRSAGVVAFELDELRLTFSAGAPVQVTRTDAPKSAAPEVSPVDGVLKAMQFGELSKP